MPGGTWIVLEGLARKEGVDLVSLGYQYNKKKVLTFVYSKGAGSSAVGKPYDARFPDKYGNVCIRHVARPQVVSHRIFQPNRSAQSIKAVWFGIGKAVGNTRWLLPTVHHHAWDGSHGLLESYEVQTEAEEMVPFAGVCGLFGFRTMQGGRKVGGWGVVWFWMIFHPIKQMFCLSLPSELTTHMTIWRNSLWRVNLGPSSWTKNDNAVHWVQSPLL